MEGFQLGEAFVTTCTALREILWKCLTCPATLRYCGPGAEAQTECPIGTYGNTRFAKSEDDCVDCPPGKYCNVTG